MKRNFRLDWWLIAPVTVLVLLSLTVLFSVNAAYFRSQLVSLVVAVVAFLFFSQSDYTFFKQIEKPLYIVSLILLFIVLGIGIESHGAVRWLDIFGVRLQFSEILKPFLALVLSSFIVRESTPSFKSFFLFFVLLLPVLLFIFLQPDLGNALIYAFVAFLTIFIAGFPLFWFGVLLIPVILFSPIVWTMLHQYQRQRILTFLHPSHDPLGASYNAIQAIIAVGSGTFLGKGLSEGTQSGLKFLPEGHTDFIFATLSEGLGFIGATLVICALAFLCYRIFIIYMAAKDPFAKVFSACAFCFFLIQFFINIGMNIGFLPIVGVTLPFVSFGGSSLLSSFIFLGILSSISIANRNREVLEIR